MINRTKLSVIAVSAMHRTVPICRAIVFMPTSYRVVVYAA